LVLTKVNKPIKVIATGLNLSSNERRATSNGRFSYGIPLNAKLMIYSGRIAPEKNIDYLLKAFPLIAEKQENVYLLMAGGGPQEQHYREMAKKISPRIIFTGMLEHDRLLELYGAADLFVYASITETQGLVLCEAKACGLPVVALFGGGISDMVRSGIDGYIVPRNMDVFVRHILRLLSDDNLRLQMGRQASLDAQERFSSIAVAKKMETVYNQLIKP
jgi:glycosyltransferase involved in cell wall biosynthesis